MPEGDAHPIECARTALNRLEPSGLLAAFAAFPPVGFVVDRLLPGVPGFSARFDLLTTTSTNVRARIRALPFYRYWKALVEPTTYFVGTTVSEYAILDAATEPRDLIGALRRTARRHRMTVVRDLPMQSALLGPRENAYADRVARAAVDAGFTLIEGQALAYVPIDFESVDDFIGRLSRGRRRDIRRKLRARQHVDVDRVPTGDAAFDDASFRARIYALYLNVFRQSETQFDLLTPAFFDALLTAHDDRGVVFLYRCGASLVAFNLCYACDGRLVDKYLGLDYTASRKLNLYCVSWFENLAYARSNGLHTYVAGWTDPEVKAALGASFTFTRHAVYIRNPLLRFVLRSIATSFEADRTWHDTRSARP